MDAAGLTDVDMAEAVVGGLANPQVRRVVWYDFNPTVMDTVVRLECGHLQGLEDSELEQMAGSNWVVCKQCTAAS